MHQASVVRAQFAQVKQIKDVVAVAPEAHRPIVSSLPQVHGSVGKNDSQSARHDNKTSARPSRLTRQPLGSDPESRFGV
jgi:hypothetical protein